MMRVGGLGAPDSDTSWIDPFLACLRPEERTTVYMRCLGRGIEDAALYAAAALCSTLAQLVPEPEPLPTGLVHRHETTLSAHEIARRLLAGPDLRVFRWDAEAGYVAVAYVGQSRIAAEFGHSEDDGEDAIDALEINAVLIE